MINFKYFFFNFQNVSIILLWEMKAFYVMIRSDYLQNIKASKQFFPWENKVSIVFPIREHLNEIINCCKASDKIDSEE